VKVQLHSFFDLGIRWRWVVSFMPLWLYLSPRKKESPSWDSKVAKQLVMKFPAFM
jgi:hypothetical protein